jgi:hypothetical protein
MKLSLLDLRRDYYISFFGLIGVRATECVGCKYHLGADARSRSHRLYSIYVQ